MEFNSQASDVLSTRHSYTCTLGCRTKRLCFYSVIYFLDYVFQTHHGIEIEQKQNKNALYSVFGGESFELCLKQRKESDRYHFCFVLLHWRFFLICLKLPCPGKIYYKFVFKILENDTFSRVFGSLAK